jgi:hypothetical protein
MSNVDDDMEVNHARERRRARLEKVKDEIDASEIATNSATSNIEIDR